MERSLLGFSVFHAISYNVSLQNGTLTASNNGGRIGRMPIHPEVMKYGDVLFADLWGALDSEKKLVSKMGTIEFHPKTVILTPKQAAPVRTSGPSAGHVRAHIFVSGFPRGRSSRALAPDDNPAATRAFRRIRNWTARETSIQSCQKTETSSLFSARVSGARFAILSAFPP